MKPSKLDTNQWLVITDLDGTLLNHESYQWHAAQVALDELNRQHIPVILNTSKTYSETLAIQKGLDLVAPFVVENGSCIFFPESQFPKPDSNSVFSRDQFWGLVLGKTHDDIEKMLHSLELEDYMIRLSKCSVDQAVELTGLTHTQARAAIAREFSEPFIWKRSDKELASFQQILLQNGFTTLQGGRFMHILGQCDKGSAIEKLKYYYPNNVKTIVLGDSANDLAMLILGDIPIVVRSPANNHLLQHMRPPYITTKQAPDGWAEGIKHALNRMKNKE